MLFLQYGNCILWWHLNVPFLDLHERWWQRLFWYLSNFGCNFSGQKFLLIFILWNCILPLWLSKWYFHFQLNSNNQLIALIAKTTFLGWKMSFWGFQHCMTWKCAKMTRLLTLQACCPCSNHLHCWLLNYKCTKNHLKM